jgi:hypothetical protein
MDLGIRRKRLVHFHGGFPRLSDSRAQNRPMRAEEETPAIANVASA